MISRKVFVVLFGCSLLVPSVNAITPQQQVTNALGNDATLLSGWFTDQFKYVIPFNSTSGNVVPSQLKIFGIEFGVEGVASSTKLDIDALHNLPTSLLNTQSLNTFSRFPLPMVMGQLKIGLPFGLDAGVRYGGIPKTNLNSGDTQGSIENKVVGIDLRKKIIDEGITRPFGLTVGINYTHASGSVDVTDKFNSLPYSFSGNSAVLNNATAVNNASWSTNSYGVQAILDKQIFFITPYIGASANVNSGHVNDSILAMGTPTIDGTTSSNISATGASSAAANPWDIRALAGIELNPLPFIHLGIGGEYAGDKNLAGSLGLRVQFR